MVGCALVSPHVSRKTLVAPHLNDITVNQQTTLQKIAERITFWTTKGLGVVDLCVVVGRSTKSQKLIWVNRWIQRDVIRYNRGSAAEQNINTAIIKKQGIAMCE